MKSFSLLEQLCAIRATSGDEGAMTEFLLSYVKKESGNWKTKPVIHGGEGFQDCILLAFGKPRTAIFIHMDSIGFTVRYKNELLRIGSPVTARGFKLEGSDSKGEVNGKLQVDLHGKLRLDAEREVEPGTRMVFSSDFQETKNSIQGAYLDNRLGIFLALELMKTMQDGLIIFSCWEEHGGGSVGYLADFMIRKYKVFQALILDVTWVTEGVKAGKGSVISLRDSGIPRRKFIDKIISLAKDSGIPFQKEVEGAGGSDGTELQKSPFPIDWCFIGPPEKNPHTPSEQVHKLDIQSTLRLYSMLLEKL